MTCNILSVRSSLQRGTKVCRKEVGGGGICSIRRRERERESARMHFVISLDQFCCYIIAIADSV